MVASGNLELVHRSGLRVGLVSVLLIICCSARPWDQQQEGGRKGDLGHGSSSMAYTAPAVKPQDPNPWLVNVDPYIPKWNESTDVNSEPPAAAAADVFNVLLYNAAGDGVTDDTKVNIPHRPNFVVIYPAYRHDQIDRYFFTILHPRNHGAKYLKYCSQLCHEYILIIGSYLQICCF